MALKVIKLVLTALENESDWNCIEYLDNFSTNYIFFKYALHNKVFILPNKYLVIGHFWNLFVDFSAHPT